VPALFAGGRSCVVIVGAVNIKAKGAFKWSSAAACASALASYEEDGYGVLAVADWKVAGAYAFIDTTLELDADMASWRASFEQVAAAAQEGEVDLDAGQGGFVRVAREKGKKKLLVGEHKSGFGEPHAARLGAWGDAIKKIEKAEAAAKKKREAERAAAEEASRKVLLASFGLGGPGLGLFAAPGGSTVALAGGYLRRVGPAGVTAEHELRGELGDYFCASEIDPETFVVWADSGPSGVILRGDKRAGFVLERDASAPEHDDRARIVDAFAGKPGEVIVHEQSTLRRVEMATGRELGRVVFPEIQREIDRGEARNVVSRGARGVALPGLIAFARNGDESCEIVAFDHQLTQAFRVEVAHRVPALVVREGRLFALVAAGFDESLVAPVTRKGLGEPVATINREGKRATPVGEDGWVLCGGFHSHAVSEGRPPLAFNHGWVARVVGVGPDDLVAIASIEYPGGIDLLREGMIVRRIVTPPGISVQGACLVGEEIVWWSYGAVLFRVRPGSSTSERLVGHKGSIRGVVGLGGSRLASLDEQGELRFWDLAAG